MTLNHPNIAAIHGLEQAEAKRFLFLELVERDMQTERLSKGQLQVEKARWKKNCFILFKQKN